MNCCIGKMNCCFWENELLLLGRWIALGKMNCCSWEDELLLGRWIALGKMNCSWEDELLLGRWIAALGKADYFRWEENLLVSELNICSWEDVNRVGDGMGWDLADNGWYLADCGWDLVELWKRSSRVVRASDCRNCPGFDPSILRHSGIWGATDEAVLNKVYIKIKKSPC
jgi:hypothetical protein